MKLYLKLKELNGTVVALIVFILLILVDVLWVFLQINRQIKLEEFFTEHGYKRVILSIDDPYSNKLFYGWRRETDTSIVTVDDRRLRRYSIKEIKQKYS